MATKSKSARCETRMMVGGHEYVLLYNMAALADAEGRTGKTITVLCQGAANGSLGVADTAALFVSGLEAARRAYHITSKAFQLQRGYELMEQAGYSKVAKAVFEAVADVLGYDEDEEDADDSADPPAG